MYGMLYVCGKNIKKRETVISTMQKKTKNVYMRIDEGFSVLELVFRIYRHTNII